MEAPRSTEVLSPITSLHGTTTQKPMTQMFPVLKLCVCVCIIIYV
jgi:hypothetical protein